MNSGRVLVELAYVHVQQWTSVVVGEWVEVGLHDFWHRVLDGEAIMDYRPLWVSCERLRCERRRVVHLIRLLQESATVIEQCAVRVYLSMHACVHGNTTEVTDGSEYVIWVWVEGLCERWHSRHRRVHCGTRRCCCVKEKSKKHSNHEERVHAMNGCLRTVKVRQRGC